MERRNFLTLIAAGTVAISLDPLINGSLAIAATEGFPGLDKFNAIIKKFRKNSLPANPYPGELISEIGKEFIGTPYIANTLEGQGTEKCRVNFLGLDCVTFYETSLDIARLLIQSLKSNQIKPDIENLLKNITYTRYRNGILTDYTSRLHYSADWIYDNGKKGVLQNITQQLGGIKHSFDVSFMSSHPQLYESLKNNPEFVSKIKETENNINSREHFIIPKNKVKGIESELRTGDYIAIATNKTGLDYAHVGMILVKNKQAHFFHASSKQKKVLIDVPIHEYLEGVSSHIGITICRPSEVKNVIPEK